MSTFPANDLVVDVARAADPQKMNAAMQRLSDLTHLRGPQGAGFDKSFQNAAATARSSAPQYSSIAPTTIQTKSTSNVEPLSTSVASDAAKKFEAFILQSFIQNVLPKEGHGAFGEGVGSGVWRSMMAEQLSTQIAKKSSFGIAKLLEHDLAQKTTAAASSRAKAATGA
jgi:peptidoglycan hydrolase FlgJ